MNQISSSLFTHDADAVKNAILDANDKLSMREAELRLSTFQDTYSPMENSDEEEYELFNVTIAYLSQLLENKRPYFRY